jgi:hypothetical protein
MRNVVAAAVVAVRLEVAVGAAAVAVAAVGAVEAVEEVAAW